MPSPTATPAGIAEARERPAQRLEGARRFERQAEEAERRAADDRDRGDERKSTAWAKVAGAKWGTVLAYADGLDAGIEERARTGIERAELHGFGRRVREVLFAIGDVSPELLQALAPMLEEDVVVEVARALRERGRR